MYTISDIYDPDAPPLGLFVHTTTLICITLTLHPNHTDHTIFQPPPSVSTTDDPNSWVVELSNNAEVINTTTIQDSATTHYLFPGLVKGTRYGVRVAGVNERGMGAFSNIVYTNTTVDRECVCAPLGLWQ